MLLLEWIHIDIMYVQMFTDEEVSSSYDTPKKITQFMKHANYIGFDINMYYCIDIFFYF